MPKEQIKDLTELERRDFYTWMVNQYHLPNKKKYSFEGHEYLIDIAKRHWKKGDNVYIRKSSQCGASELALAMMFWMQERRLPDWQGIAYFFPAKSQLDDHVKSRVMPITEIPRFGVNVTLNNLSYLKYCGLPILFRSGQTRRNLISFAADFIIGDEFDEFENPMSVIPTIKARFNHSDYKWILGLSTPTYPDIGIDAAFKTSNQYYYHIPCQKCKKDFSPLTEVEIRGFENCVVRDSATKEVGFICPHCQELTNTCGVLGKWVLEHEVDNQNYGYSVSRLFTPRTTLKELLELYEDTSNIQEFYNSNLGLPYSPANSKLSHGDIVRRCIGDAELATYSKEETWCGIDVGKKCNWIVATGNSKDINVIAYGICTFDEIEKLLYKFNVRCLVIDLRPEEQSVKRIIKGKAGFYASDYNVGKQENWYTLTKADKEVSGGRFKVIKNDRTQTSDVVINKVSIKEEVTFPSSTKSDNKFIKQLCAMQRMEEEDKKTGEIRAYYGNAGKADHYFHALGYLILAFQIKKMRGGATPGQRIW